MLREAVVLAGGLGTRLRPVISDQPKVLAPVAGKPFLYYIISSLLRQNVSRIVLSTGYKSELIEQFVKTTFAKKNIIIAKEEKPLGTGGGVINALAHCNTDEVLVLNGDTFFNIDYSFFYHHHHHHEALYSIALKPLADAERYGTVECNGQHRIKSFREKQEASGGLINAGVYIINRSHFISNQWPEVFSLEKDFFEKYCSKMPLFGFPYDEYFIDIGIPSDYEQAQADFKSLFA